MSLRTPLLLAAALILGCGEAPAPASATDRLSTELQASQRLPADPQLAALYQRSCQACHAVAATGAPLTGDDSAWAPRLAQGMDTLLNHVVDGFGGMPPLGLCMDCSAEEFAALISFMSQAEAQP